VTSAPTPTPEGEARYFFIRRPVLAAVMSIVITLLGLFAIRLLPVARYPQITPPAVRITAVYPGASSEDAAQAVAAPIEQQLAGLEGMLYYSSTNSSDGTTTITVTFDVNRNQDLAAVDVQNAVKLAEPQLPEAVRTNGVTILKANTDILAVVALQSKDPRYDATFLANYMKLYVVDELKRVPGVGDANAFPQRDFSMYLKLDPEKMAQLQITVNDVVRAVREQNATNPAGRIGREPAPEGSQLTLSITTQGRLKTEQEFNDIVVRATPDGSLVRVRDIGQAELGARSYDLRGRLNTIPSAFLLLYSRPGSNALAVKDAVVQRMNELQQTFPQGVYYVVPFDTTPFVTASIREVVITLLEAMLLVTLVVFLFLQSWRATLIPMLAVPVSVIGTFLGLYLFGFSINVLTLFGLVLAIGIVVDDAIVVIENVERIMATEGLSARAAADKAIRQVASALVAIVLVLCSVFIPVAFVGGVTGELFKQFAITIAISVVISGIVALTLTPALCALLLEEAVEAHTTGFFGWFNRGFKRATGGYARAVDSVLGRPAAWVGAFLIVLALAGVLWQRIPSAFIPTEDKGYMAISVQLPDAASLQRTEAVVKQIESIVRAEKAVRNVVALVGLDLLSGGPATNGATMFLNVKPWEERDKHDALDSIAARVNMKMFMLKDARAFGFNLPEVPGLGISAGIEVNLQNRTGQDIREFAQDIQEFRQASAQLPAAGQLNSTFRAGVPQLYMTVDRAAAKSRGVDLGELFNTMQTFLSTLYINDFELYGKTFRVQAEALPEFREQPSDIGRLYVRGTNNVMIPISSLLRSEYRSAPDVIRRFNGFTSAQFTGPPSPGHGSGELLAQIDQLVQSEFVGKGIGIGYSGQSFQERASKGDAGLVFALGLVIVFLVLAAQYESWSIPFAVILGVPFGVLGALLGIWIRNQPNDIYFQVGLITVVGLAAKNAILIVEFANELRNQGMSLRQAAVEAARERLRPILMTSFAFILGVLPLMLATGAGAMSKHSLGTGVFAGMLFATTIGIFFIPLFFRIIRGLSERGRKGEAKPKSGETTPLLTKERMTAMGLMLIALLATSCRSVGPDYRAHPPVPASTQLKAQPQPDTLRAFFDSLAAARQRDSAVAARPINARTVTYDSAVRVSWLDIVRDTALVRLIDQALRQNRTMQVAVARIREYRADVGIARAALFPTLTANTGVARNQIAFGSNPITFQAFTLNGAMSWELDFWGRVRRGIEAANADVGVQEAAERALALSLIGDVASGYLQLLELDEEEAIASRTLASRRASLDLARERYQRGVVSELDVRQFEALLAAPAVTISQSQRARAQTEHALNVLVGEAPRRIDRGLSLQQAVDAIEVPDSVPVSLLARRPDVIQAERAFAAATARVGVSMAARLPAIAITGSYGRQAEHLTSFFSTQNDVYQTAIGVSVPVFNGGRQKSEVAAARARADQARAQFEQVALSALRDANDALVAVRTTRDQSVALATQVNALRKALELAELRYTSGAASYLEVLDAQRSLYAAELSLSQAQLQRLIAAVQLYQALGGSWK
jgi:multidrug efflux pump